MGRQLRKTELSLKYGEMQISNRIFEKYDNYRFKIPLVDGDKVIAKEGEVNTGDILFEKLNYPLKKTINISKALGCKSNESENYVLKIDGEYVERGEVIARKTSSGKLNVLQFMSPVSGVIDLGRIKSGYIDILGEQTYSVIKSDFTGAIESIDPIIGMIISTNAVAIDGVVSSGSKEKLFGKLEILGDGYTILNESSLNEDYRGKIVWVGPYLYEKVAGELFEKGALGIITYAMSYEQFRELGLPVLILGGFGFVHCDNEFLNRFLEFKDKFVMIDMEENQLFVISDSNIRNKEWFVTEYINQRVISRSPSTYGYIGTVIDYESETNNILIDFGKRGRSLMNIGLVDFIDL